MAFKITKKAASDIEEIFKYTLDNWSEQQAERYCKLIFDEILFLSDFPESGKNCEHLRKNYMSSKVKSHLIFYKNIPGKNHIEIMRILHESMDIKNRVSE